MKDSPQGLACRRAEGLPVCLCLQDHEASVRPGGHDSVLVCGGAWGDPLPVVPIRASAAGDRVLILFTDSFKVNRLSYLPDVERLTFGLGVCPGRGVRSPDREE